MKLKGILCPHFQRFQSDALTFPAICQIVFRRRRKNGWRLWIRQQKESMKRNKERRVLTWREYNHKGQLMAVDCVFRRSVYNGRKSFYTTTFYENQQLSVYFRNLSVVRSCHRNVGSTCWCSKRTLSCHRYEGSYPNG